MWVKGELVVKGPKTASGVRTIPLPAWLIADISAVMNVRAASAGIAILATDRLFTSPTGKPMLDHTIWRIVKCWSRSSSPVRRHRRNCWYRPRIDLAVRVVRWELGRRPMPLTKAPAILATMYSDFY